ncbi:hypothetical protein D7316_02838 [Gordonia insulae]|uniref:HTH-type transcriptional repressor KstR2 C-terminal domain-containing protein n=2 Tax=Gordonia insulae TaxID=2420509 RepID=A0A3G8JMD7_9ACTN|nr:hypothetical protein D7316_02838 [Gordonia insulae]
MVVEDEQLAVSDWGFASEAWFNWNHRLTDALTEQLRNDVRDGLAHPATADIERLIIDLNYMMQHAFYLNSASKADTTETQRMFTSVTAIWLAAAWGHPTSSTSRPATDR